MKSLPVFVSIVCSLGRARCDGARTLSQPGLPTACSAWYTAKVSDTCLDIAGNHSLDVQAFMALNPQLNNDCHNSLWASYAYCIAAPTATAPPPPPPPPPPPAPTQTPAPAQAPAAVKAGGGPGGPPPPNHGYEHEGDLTYYAVGLGSCGVDDSGKDQSDNIVALPHGVMGDRSNGNPNCGKSVTIQYQGKTATAVVHDKCMGCEGDSIDASEKVWTDLGIPLTAGRVKVQWSFTQ